MNYDLGRIRMMVTMTHFKSQFQNLSGEEREARINLRTAG
jgi:hypothetical protein